jgi:carbon-monoxide dehydrogenase small subunit
MRSIQLTINNETYEVSVRPKDILLDVLRDQIGLTGTKKGCDVGECGACTILMEGDPVNACLVLAIEADGKEILTIESLAKDGQLDPLQQAFIDEGAIQCGFCTPGMILSAKALLDKNPKCTQDEIKEGISGNLCRCTGYVKIVKAIETAATKMGTK